MRCDVGLLENSTMLLLPLGGNASIERSKTLALLQEKLRNNRAAYARAAAADPDSPSQSDAASNSDGIGSR